MIDSSRLIRFLEEKGYEPQYDPDGDICFKVDGHPVYLCHRASDANFIRIMGTNLWFLQTDEEVKVASRIAQAMTHKHKVAKISVVRNENVAVSLELFLPDTEAVITVFQRCLDTLDAAASDFWMAMYKATYQEWK